MDVSFEPRIAPFITVFVVGMSLAWVAVAFFTLNSYTRTEQKTKTRSGQINHRLPKKRTESKQVATELGSTLSDEDSELVQEVEQYFKLWANSRVNKSTSSKDNSS